MNHRKPGLACPKCKRALTGVIDSRLGPNNRSKRRRRECLSCGYRFTTYEIVLDKLPEASIRELRYEYRKLGNSVNHFLKFVKDLTLLSGLQK